MTTIEKSALQIKCPHCGNKFMPEHAIEHDLKAQLEKEYDKKLEKQSKTMAEHIKKQEEEKYAARLKALESDRQTKAERLAELEERSVSIGEQEQALKSRELQLETEMRKRLLEREKLIREEAEKMAMETVELQMNEKQVEIERQKESMEVTLRRAVREQTEKAREEERMKAADLQKKLDDQTRLVNEMQRKAGQGSMQAQGEVQELAIEAFLQCTFIRDEIQEVSKGKRGADCVHVVKDSFGNTCGTVLYESKRTRNFGSEWTSKLREDMRRTSADIGVLVTEVLPGDMTHFGMYDGVWVCTFAEFKALAFLFRDSLTRLGELRSAKENRGEKMQMLYGYLTSVEFRQKIEAMVESFQAMQDDLAKEKAHTLGHWARREKQIYKVMQSTVELYGDVRGIAGTAVQEISALEMEEVKLLVREG